MNEADPDNNIFLVEKLLNRRWRKNRVEYLVKWMGYPNSENTWEPKQNINPRLVDQYDTEHGGPMTGPASKAPKRTSTAPSAINTSLQRSRPRAPPKPREVSVTSSRGRRRRGVENETASETNTSTASVDESKTCDAQASTGSEEPAAKKARVEEKPNRSAKEIVSKPEIIKVDLSEKPETPCDTLSDKPNLSGAEPPVNTASAEIVEDATQEETVLAGASAVPAAESEVKVVEEVKASSDADLTEQQVAGEVPAKQPELVYEYEQTETEAVEQNQSSSTAVIEEQQAVIETPEEQVPSSNASEQTQKKMVTYEALTYVVEEDGQELQIQIHGPSPVLPGSNNGTTFSLDDQPTKLVVGDLNAENKLQQQQQEDQNSKASISAQNPQTANWTTVTEVTVGDSTSVSDHFRRPDSTMKRYHDSDEDDYYGQSSGSYSSRKVELNLSKDRVNFVSSSSDAAKQSYGLRETTRADALKQTDKRRLLTSDERNALAAKMLKAELGGKERAKALKKKLEAGYADDDAKVSTSGDSDSVILMKMDKKSGLVTPVTSTKGKSKDVSKGGSSSTVLSAYERSATLQELVAEEKTTTSEDQLGMFDRAVKMTARNKTTDDHVVDDNVEAFVKTHRHAEKESRKEQSRQISQHKQLERTLASCELCFSNCDKLTVVAVGFKTYLAIVPWKGLHDAHCRILPIDHCSCTINLDEDVQAEMLTWRKALVAMFAAEDEDCVFMETSKVVSGRNHLAIECIPLPRESGDLAPIYFKQALENAGAQWSTHKKIFKLSDVKDGTVRSLIPKGFSYFAVDFGLQSGFAHVVEDVAKFPHYFGQEIIGGIIDAEHKKWRCVDMESPSELKAKRDAFRRRWSLFDWTDKTRDKLNKS